MTHTKYTVTFLLYLLRIYTVDTQHTFTLEFLGIGTNNIFKLFYTKIVIFIMFLGHLYFYTAFTLHHWHMFIMYLDVAGEISCLMIFSFYLYIRGPGSSVGTATDYGLDSPGSNPGGDEIFRPYRPALGPTQPPAQGVLGLSRG